MDRNGGSSEEDADTENNPVDPQAEDQELKGQLLRKYSGYLGNLKQEFMKKRKKGKLPKEARQQLLEWWSRHYKWPYPSVINLEYPHIIMQGFLIAYHYIVYIDIASLVQLFCILSFIVTMLVSYNRNSRR